MNEHRNTEFELQETRLKLQRMSEFLTNLSHEVRTPLTALLTTCEVLQNGIAGPVTNDQLIEINVIQNSGYHLLELMDEVFDLSKIESGFVDLKISEVSINLLCESSLQLVMQQAKQKNIQLTSSITVNQVSLHADEKLLRQMLVNLLDNAIKFTPEFGEVTIVVEFSRTSNTRHGNGEPAVRFNVTDTGIGIDESEHESVFKPFVQIDTQQLDNPKRFGYGGIGIGLALVRQFAILHGGGVGLRSKVGRGSCFYIDLPLRASNNTSGQLPEETGTSQHRSS